MSAKPAPKVLLVEDDKELLDLYSSAFMREGFTVYSAPNGKEGIEKFHRKEPDIVLLDIMMPEGNGYEVLKNIRKNMTRYTPVIMLTNIDTTTFSKHARFEEVDAYLIKSNHVPAEVVAKTFEVLKLNKITPSSSL